MLLPKPEMFSDWQSWGSSMISRLSSLASPQRVDLPRFAKASLPDAKQQENCLIYVTDEVGGPVPAFSDGVAWRRVTDRLVVA